MVRMGRAAGHLAELQWLFRDRTRASRLEPPICLTHPEAWSSAGSTSHDERYMVEAVPGCTLSHINAPALQRGWHCAVLQDITRAGRRKHPTGGRWKVFDTSVSL
jgi:hypothetical protein